MRARIAIVASVIAVALAAAVTYAGSAAQSAAPASSPAVCPASSPAPTAGAQAPTAAPPASETSLPCFAYGACLSCPDGTAQPCLIVQCGTHRTTHCGACTPNCVPPPE
jgi:hypothetical protein